MATHLCPPGPRRLHEADGRSATGALGTMLPELQLTIRHLRETHPGWGSDSILISLRAEAAWKTQRFPSRSRVAAFLQQAGLTRRYQKHADLPQPARQLPEAPHQEWQMDAQGAYMSLGSARSP